MSKIRHSPINVLDCYSYVWDYIIRPARSGKKIPVDIIDVFGGRYSGKTVMFCPFLWTLLCDHVDTSWFEFICFRKTQIGARDLFEDVSTVLDAYNVPYSSLVSKNKISYNNNTMRIYGLESNTKSASAKKAGLPRVGDVKYCFVFFEERFEFDEEDISWIKQAMRSIGQTKTQFIYISASNPWAKSHPYIAGLLNKQPFNESKMRRDGSQVGVYDIKRKISGLNGETELIEEKQLIHYTNWRIVQQYLAPEQKAEILNSYNISRVRGMTVDLGFPGYESGGIYTDFLNNLAPAAYIQHEFVLGGVDYGWSEKTFGGKTIALFMGASEQDGIDIYGEFSHSNSEQPISSNAVAEKIILFYKDQMSIYMNKLGLCLPIEMWIRVDNANNVFIDMLNDTAKKYRVNWLHFTSCAKLPVQDRINVTIALLAQQKLRINENTSFYPVKVLKSEFEFATYKETEKQARTKKNDHAINAFEYAIEPMMKRFANSFRLGMMKVGKW